MGKQPQDQRSRSAALLSMIDRKLSQGRIEVLGERRHPIRCDCDDCIRAHEDDY